MHVGLYLAPQTSGAEEDISNIEAVVEQALEADEAGFSTVYLTEHHLDDYNSYGDSHMLGAHLAGRLKNAWLASSVTLVTLHHPLRIVQQFNLLDVLSKGRVIFGLAGGGGPFMYEGMGRDPSRRIEALDSTIDAMLQIWAHQPGETLEFETPYDHGKISARVMPAPYRKAHPHLARGTNSAETMAKYAKLGWPVMVGRLPPERMGETTRFYRSELEAAGQSEDTIRWCMQWMASTKIVYISDTDEKAHAEAEGPMKRYFELAGRSMSNITGGGRYGGLDGANIAREARSYDEFIKAAWLIGSPDTVLKELKAYEAAGVPQMRLWFTFGPGSIHEAYKRSFRMFIDEVMPALNPEPIWDPQAVGAVV
jgi:alkanesulfonate monooxygenase SsuD/methylene tetrahydromethanopterin reductase-like flavin-dependent oxidoreductase (luciferase family)